MVRSCCHRGDVRLHARRGTPGPRRRRRARQGADRSNWLRCLSCDRRHLRCARKGGSGSARHCDAERDRGHPSKLARWDDSLDRRSTIDFSTDCDAESRRHRARGARHHRLLVRAPMNRPALSIFSNASDAASRIAMLAWFMIGLSAIILIIVIATMAIAVMRNRERDPLDVDLRERGIGSIIWGGAVLPTVVLIAVFVVSLGAMSKFSPPT